MISLCHMNLHLFLIKLFDFAPSVQMKFRLLYRKFFIKRIVPDFVKLIAHDFKNLDIVSKSKSQIFQDLFVLNTLNYKRNGYFIDIGASDGISISNTYLLEDSFNWSGILVEPNRSWFYFLKKNRKSPICTKAVYSESNLSLEFNDFYFPELSKLRSFSSDNFSQNKFIRNKYLVQTTTLMDLFEYYSVPNFIDYLSIGIEGLEYEVLQDFDFNKYVIGIITCEHNNSENKKLISDLLLSNGYVESNIHGSDFESWFTKSFV